MTDLTEKLSFSSYSLLFVTLVPRPNLQLRRKRSGEFGQNLWASPEELITIHSTQLRAMKSEHEEDMVMIPRLNALVRIFGLRIALLETTQKMSENQALHVHVAINLFVRKNDVFNCLPTDAHSSGRSLC